MIKKLGLGCFLLAGVLLLNACGFQLRGQGFDLQQTQVWLFTQNPNANFERALKQRLNTQGGQWVDEIEQADLQLVIDNYFTEERVIARDSNGRPSELELIFNLDYRLKSRTDDAEQAKQLLSSRREFAYDRNLETGQEVEKQRLINDMQQEIISRLMLQMAKLN